VAQAAHLPGDARPAATQQLLMIAFGRLLLIIGLAMALIGSLILIAGRFFPWLGNLPGDIRYESENVKIYIPLATMILVSILATILLNIFYRFFRR
jgi:Protein of unknown function (DUF2905)